MNTAVENGAFALQKLYSLGKCLEGHETTNSELTLGVDSVSGGISGRLRPVGEKREKNEKLYNVVSTIRGYVGMVEKALKDPTAKPLTDMETKSINTVVRFLKIVNERRVKSACKWWENLPIIGSTVGKVASKAIELFPGIALGLSFCSYKLHSVFNMTEKVFEINQANPNYRKQPHIPPRSAEKNPEEQEEPLKSGASQNVKQDVNQQSSTDRTEPVKTAPQKQSQGSKVVEPVVVSAAKVDKTTKVVTFSEDSEESSESALGSVSQEVSSPAVNTDQIRENVIPAPSNTSLPEQESTTAFPTLGTIEGSKIEDLNRKIIKVVVGALYNKIRNQTEGLRKFTLTEGENKQLVSQGEHDVYFNPNSFQISVGKKPVEAGSPYYQFKMRIPSINYDPKDKQWVRDAVEKFTLTQVEDETIEVKEGNIEQIDYLIEAVENIKVAFVQKYGSREHQKEVGALPKFSKEDSVSAEAFKKINPGNLLEKTLFHKLSTKECKELGLEKGTTVYAALQIALNPTSTENPEGHKIESLKQFYEVCYKGSFKEKLAAAVSLAAIDLGTEKNNGTKDLTCNILKQWLSGKSTNLGFIGVPPALNGKTGFIGSKTSAEEIQALGKEFTYDLSSNYGIYLKKGTGEVYTKMSKGTPEPVKNNRDRWVKVEITPKPIDCSEIKSYKQLVGLVKDSLEFKIPADQYASLSDVAKLSFEGFKAELPADFEKALESNAEIVHAFMKKAEKAEQKEASDLENSSKAAKDELVKELTGKLKEHLASEAIVGGPAALALDSEDYDLDDGAVREAVSAALKKVKPTNAFDAIERLSAVTIQQGDKKVAISSDWLLKEVKSGTDVGTAIRACFKDQVVKGVKDISAHCTKGKLNNFFDVEVLEGQKGVKFKESSDTFYFAPSTGVKKGDEQPDGAVSIQLPLSNYSIMRCPEGVTLPEGEQADIQTGVVYFDPSLQPKAGVRAAVAKILGQTSLMKLDNGHGAGYHVFEALLGQQVAKKLGTLVLSQSGKSAFGDGAEGGKSKKRRPSLGAPFFGTRKSPKNPATPGNPSEQTPVSPLKVS